MLTILLATCETALTKFLADDEVDRELVTDLERLIERTRAALESLVRKEPPAA